MLDKKSSAPRVPGMHLAEVPYKIRLMDNLARSHRLDTCFVKRQNGVEWGDKATAVGLLGRNAVGAGVIIHTSLGR